MARGPTRALPSTAELLGHVSYDATSGVITRNYRADARKEWNTRYAGRPAGCVQANGYITVQIDRERYLAHRLIWKIMTGRDPCGEVDHIDLDPQNNAWSNLRQCTSSENLTNRRMRRDNRAGLKGVCFHPQSGKFRARIRKNNVVTDLGLFWTREEAHAAYAAAATRLHGQFARTA